MKENDPPAVDFEGKVLDGITKIQTKQDTLVEDYNRLQKETKQAFEDLTKVKNQLNSVAEFEASLKKVQVAMRREQRMAYGDPVRRITENDEMRARFNAAVRLAAAGQNDRIRAAGQLLAKGLDSENTPGSTLITDELAREMYDVLATYGVWNTFGVQRVGTRSTKFPVTTTRPIAKFVRKMASRKLVDDTNIAGTSVDCVVELAGVLLGVEEELLEDSGFDVTNYVLDNFGEAMALLMDHTCLTADGTDDSADAEMLGIFETGTAAAAASGNTTVETLDYEDYLRCLTTVAPIVLKRSSRWWMHPQIIARSLAVKDLNGRPIFLTATEAPTYGGIGSILGYPVTPAFAAPSTNTASSKVAAFGDPRGHVFGLRTDFGFAASDDFAFDSVKRYFRATARFGGITRAATAFAILTLAAS